MMGGSMSGPAKAQTRRQHGRIRWKTFFVLLLTAFAAFRAEPLRAQSGITNRAVGGGLRIDVETQWPDGAGYRPVRVTVVPTLASVADRTLVFEFTTIDFNRGREDEIRVVQDIELPAGAGPVTTTLSVPYMIGHTNYGFRVGEGGRNVKGLSGSGSFQSNAHMEMMPRVLLVSDQNVATSSLGRLFLNVNMNPPQQSGQYPLPTFHMVGVKDMPSRWIDFSALDMICLSLDDLQTMKKAQPDGFRALLDWTAAGGNLLVFGVGAEWEHRGLLERLVGLPAGDGNTSKSRSPWQSPRSNQFGKKVEGIGAEALGPYQDISEVVQPGYYNPYGNPTVTIREEPEVEKPAKKPTRPEVPSTAPFVSRPYEMGMLVAIAEDKPFDEDPGFWAWLCNHLTSRRVIWYQRHGISLQQDNADFFKFLIEGVGKAPLNAFRVLISLFVLAIGPFNYYLLRRFRRLHLLVVTVPVSAAAVTLALFAYAIFSDGLGTRVRVRSVTRINQATGQTECWARLSYYSGLAPGDGLTFPEDVAVYPIQAFVGDLANGDRDLVWYQGQKLTNGWLRSRTPTQFLTVRSRKSQLGIGVGQASAEGLAIENRLGTDVELLVLRDKDGTIYWATDLADGTKTHAATAVPADAFADLQAKIHEVKMVNPPGVDPTDYQYSYNRRYYYYNSYGGNGPAPMVGTSLMEGAIQEIAQTSPSRLDGLPPGSYAAVARLSPEVELGTTIARPEASLHLVIGSW
ncbi:MAG: hypothetical protein GXX96_12155 [Planctomycetaceae bacterium]|nr:hypothetical protein [Planctomycetaceae bacterium]